MSVPLIILNRMFHVSLHETSCLRLTCLYCPHTGFMSGAGNRCYIGGDSDAGPESGKVCARRVRGTGSSHYNKGRHCLSAQRVKMILKKGIFQGAVFNIVMAPERFFVLSCKGLCD